MLKDQLEKQPIVRKVKNPNFNNVSFRNLLDNKSMKIFDEIRYQDEIIDYSRLNFIGSSKKYTFRFGNFMSLGNLAQNIYIRCCKIRTKKICLNVLLITIRLKMCITIKK